MPITLFSIFRLFLLSGGLAIGDGYATIQPIRKAITKNQQWISEEDFDAHLAIVQAIPGIFNVNLAAFLGHKLKGWPGSVVALAGMVLPPFALLILVAQFYDSFRSWGWVESFLMGARPAIIALLILTCARMLKKSNLSLSTIWIPMCAAIAIVLLGISPVYIIAGFTFLGVLYAIQVLMSEH